MIISVRQWRDPFSAMLYLQQWIACTTALSKRTPTCIAQTTPDALHLHLYSTKSPYVHALLPFYFYYFASGDDFILEWTQGTGLCCHLWALSISQLKPHVRILLPFVGTRGIAIEIKTQVCEVCGKGISQKQNEIRFDSKNCTATFCLRQILAASN